MRSMFSKVSVAGPRLLCVSLISALLIFLDVNGKLTAIHRESLLLTEPVYVIVNAPAQFYHWVIGNLRPQRALQTENEKLERELLFLQGRQQTFQALEMENNRLRHLLEASPRIDKQFLVAELLSVDANPLRHQVILNKGEQDGVLIGQAVIDALGIMGQIVAVGPWQSHVLLITDPTHATPVQVNRNGMRAIAMGTGVSNQLELIHIAETADILVGDLIVSSGLDEHFPAGYPVGIIERIVEEPGRPFVRVFVRPSAELDRSQMVLVLALDAKIDREESQ